MIGFEALVDQTAGPGSCWPWRGSTNNYGYGIFYFRRRTVLAHRAIYALYVGRVRHCVLHRCDLPICCNPRHLFQGTYAENNRDRWLKGRYRACPNPVRRKATA